MERIGKNNDIVSHKTTNKLSKQLVQQRKDTERNTIIQAIIKFIAMTAQAFRLEKLQDLLQLELNSIYLEEILHLLHQSHHQF